MCVHTSTCIISSGCECTDYFRDVLVNLLVPILRTWNLHFDPIQLTLKGLHISLLAPLVAMVTIT